MPRAKPFPEAEEEEKTTIESQWEDEASTTTVEQGDAADKIRSLIEPRRPPNTSTGTGTGTGALDELTVDDQQAHLSAITPVRDVARLQITAGNDAGNEIEIRPGKTYTIGRAIDNDVVLTDISVSRKHFDLRFEDGAWVIVDRGSGNGTVVNGNLEDNPFMLANGDVIEIGNTAFRFDQPNAASRPERTVDLGQDDEEPSTVAGKPPRPAEPPPASVAEPQVRLPRPKTLPPPTPLRARGSTQPPPAYPPIVAAQQMPPPSQQMPAQMMNRPPMQAPGMPAMLGDPNNLSQPSATIGPTSAQRPIYPYPQATEIPPHSVHAQMLLIQTQQRRGDGSTVLVPPTPYDMMPMAPRYSQAQLSKRAKLVLSGVGLAVFAAVMTIAIVKSGNGKKSAAANPPAEKVKLDSKQTEPKLAAKPTPEPVTVQPTVTAPTPTVAKTETPSVAKTETPTVAKTETPTVAKTETPTVARSSPRPPRPSRSRPPRPSRSRPPRPNRRPSPRRRRRPPR